MALTRTPERASSPATERTSPTTAALETLYGCAVIWPSTPAMLAVQMMLPLRRGAMTRAACLTPAMTPRVLIAMTASKSARSSAPSSGRAREPTMPALLSMMSSLPWRATARSTAAATCALVGDVAAGVGRGVGRQGAAQVVLDVGEHDLGAVPDELRGRRLADAASGAGDHRHLAGQPLGARGRGVAALAGEASHRRRRSATAPSPTKHTH
uniref:Uncharacterized protein n=1 Tax=Triticum urartu TaxID=4572 RepID=A0A8R7PB10_TRIUA